MKFKTRNCLFFSSSCTCFFLLLVWKKIGHAVVQDTHNLAFEFSDTDYFSRGLDPNFCQKESETLDFEELFTSGQSAITSDMGPRGINMWLVAQRNMAGEISH